MFLSKSKYMSKYEIQRYDAISNGTLQQQKKIKGISNWFSVEPLQIYSKGSI